MENIYQENLEEIERQNELIKKHEYEKQELLNRINRLDSIIDRKKRIVEKKKNRKQIYVKK